MTRFRHAIACLAACLGAVGCSYRDLKDAGGLSPAPADRTLSFEQVRSGVLEKHCLQCHTTQAPLLSNYAQVRAAADAIRGAALGAQPAMPPDPGPKLTSDEQAFLRRWLDEGAPEQSGPLGSPPPASPPSPAPVGWATLKAKVLDVSCNGCHTPGNAQGIPDLTTYDAFKPVAPTSYGLAVIYVDTPAQMPPAPASLTREQKEIFSRWLIDGQRP